MKKISILIPCYNEVENVGPISQAVTDILKNELPQYDYELVFIDNDSTDGTREVLRLCAAVIRRSRRFLMPAISDSLTPPTMVCSR